MMGTKRTEKACATRKQLLEAALAVIGEKGYSAATVNEIVDAAGVSKGVAYYHFKSKAVMAESILEEGIGGLIEGFERIAAEAPTAPEALTGMVELFATSIFENKAFGRFFVSELWREGRVWSRSMRDYEGRGSGADRHGADHHAVLHRRREPAAGRAVSPARRGTGDRRQKRFHRAYRRFRPTRQRLPGGVGVGVARA